MTSEHKLLYEELVDRINEEYEDKELDPPAVEDIDAKLDELCELDYLVCEDVNDGEYVIYSARPGLKWCDFHELACPIKKQILLYLVENPNSFVVLLNTQRGKAAIVAKHMTEWTQNNMQIVGARSEAERQPLVIPILFVDNDRTLAEQSEQSLATVPNKYVYQLSSNASHSVTEIKMHIDLMYHRADGYETPIIMSLPNAQQLNKVVSIMEHIVQRNRERGWNIKYAIITDEFDKVYPLIRPKLLPFIAQTEILHRIGWISATAGNIDDYPECANAYFESHPEDSPDYRAFHHSESVVKIIPRAPHSRSAFINKVLGENREHFWSPIQLNSGEEAYRRIIVNSDTSRTKMESLAKALSTDGSYCITLNMHGLKLFVDGAQRAKYRIRGQRLNEVIFAVFKIHGLRDKPLFVIGGKKVDRGLGFHYAPRRGVSGEFNTQTIVLRGETVYSENGEGLIFTDEILGSVDTKSTAVQKAGRGAGVIAQCPQYSGSVYYWTNQHTADTIMRHNAQVDTMNQLPGAYTARQAEVRGAEMTRIEPRRTYGVFSVDGRTEFDTAEDARTAFNAKNFKREKKDRSGVVTQVAYTASIYYTYKYNESNELEKCRDQSEGTHIKRRTVEPILTAEQFEQSTDLEWGTGDHARIMPVRYPTGIKWKVIYKLR